MKEVNFEIDSADKKLKLSCLKIIPNGDIKGIVQIAHGMAEHKERYIDFMYFLAEQGFVSVINDHRGHGESILEKDDLGYFYDETGKMIIEDFYLLSEEIMSEYPNVPLLIFSHSMGTLVARNYLKKHDQTINGLILCGAPYNNPLSKLALNLTKGIMKIKGEKHRSNLIQKLSFSSYDNSFDEKEDNRWLNSDMNEVIKYNDNPLCGYTFTTNGFINLFHLMIATFIKEDYEVKNKDLPILFIAGNDDPVIGGEDNFDETVEFIQNLGYTNVRKRLYFSMRHEILNEKNKIHVYEDILKFYNEAI